MHFATLARCAVSSLVVSSAALSQQLPQHRPLGPTVARSSTLLSSVSMVQAHSDGSILVHDLRGRRIVWMNAALDSLVPVADQSDATNRAYNSAVAGFIPWHGDSLLFVDPPTFSMLLFDAAGKVGRVMAMPNAAGLCFIGGPSGLPALDNAGRVVCRMPRSTRPSPVVGGQVIFRPEVADSAALVRFDLQTRRSDTVTFLRLAKQEITTNMNARCEMFVQPLLNPLPVADDWTVMPDGSVAVVRARQFRVERFATGSAPRLSSAIPYNAVRLTDDRKSAYIDSTRAALERLRPPAPVDSSPLVGQRCDPQSPRAVSILSPAVADDPVRMAASGRSTAGFSFLFVPPADLPDYVPVFAPGGVRADADGNIWVRTLETVRGGSIYNVIDANDSLAARILVPPGRVIAGFGKNGVVYMGVTETGGVRLERAVIR